MKNLKFMCLALLGAIVLSACHKTLDHKSYIDYLNDPENGLSIKKCVNQVDFTLTYWPSELLVWQELQGRSEVSEKEKQELMDHYGKFHYLKLEISHQDREILTAAMPNRDLYSRLVSRFSFRMRNHAYLICQPTDTLQFVDAHAPRYYGIAPSTQIVLVYEKEQEIGDLRLELKDLELGTGGLRFEFAKRKLKKLPKLKFQAPKK